MRKLFLICSMFISTIFATRQEKQNDQYKKQYFDFARIHNKQISEEGLENFMESMSLVESSNRDNTNRCKLYLTQYSDTKQENRFFKKC